MFEDCEPLTLTDEELNILNHLHVCSLKTKHEYGQVFNADGFSEPFTSNLEDRVFIPENSFWHPPIRLYHSHTNDTLLSQDDYTLLLNPKVERISVVTATGKVFSCTIGNGVVPGVDEYLELLLELEEDLSRSIPADPRFLNWSQERRFYEYMREKSFRIARYFKWRLEGGTL